MKIRKNLKYIYYSESVVNHVFALYLDHLLNDSVTISKVQGGSALTRTIIDFRVLESEKKMNKKTLTYTDLPI